MRTLILFLLLAAPLHAETIRGTVTTPGGDAIAGAMISAFDDERRQSTSVFSQADGSFALEDLHNADFRLRARLLGKRDRWIDDVNPKKPVTLTMEPVTGRELQEQRPASSAFGMLPFDSVRDKLNFKMMCSYCHQTGTLGFRTPEEPVDWETMITRMDGFGGLYPHSRDTIVQRIIDAYKDDAVDSWPEYIPPPPPTGMAANAKITAWEVGEPYEGSYHDLEPGPDGLMYAVNIRKNTLVTLDPKNGAQTFQKFPRGTGGAHSIELANDNSLWTTMCGSGHMARYDVDTKKFLHRSSAEAPAARGSYPHTLRINPADPEGLIWYTDAGRNSVFSMHPTTHFVKEYHLLKYGQAEGGGKGESRGVTPYGIDYSPVDGMIWYSKLNGNRIGRIDPKAPDGDIKEWNPPFRGPRRLHVAPDGIVWVPGFGSGVFGKFDPATEKWTTYPLPDYQNQIPYALNVAPDGMVWICGTHNDCLYRFNPATEYLVEFRLPHRVSYTREIEFDADGNVWTSTSGPPRHMERACGEIIKLELLDKSEEELGGIKLASIQLSADEQGILSEAERAKRERQLGELYVRIEARELPKDYPGGGPKHQPYVDRIMASLPEDQRGRVGRLFNQRRQLDVPMENPGNVFIKILDYIVEESKKSAAAEMPHVHRLDSSKRTSFDAFAYVNRIPNAEKNESPHAHAGRIHGRLANQEGRVLLKLPPGMNRAAYEGFKTFLGSEGEAKVTNCVKCHAPGDFQVATTGSLRNLDHPNPKLVEILRSKIARAASGDPAYAKMAITDADIPHLVAFLNTLTDVPEPAFRDLILSAVVLDTTPDRKPEAKSSPSLTGTVRFEGPRPKRLPLRMDEPSAKLYEKPPLNENILINKEGGLANVFIAVVEGLEAKDYPAPTAPAIIDQQRSMFRPRVQGLRVGQEVLMKNGDPFIHNIRSLSMKNRPFNIAQPANTPDRTKSFDAVEGPITIKCDFHRWMTAHFFVMEHPFFAVTDAKGHFEIPDLPPGKYTLEAWHEVFGKQRQEITVSKKGSVSDFQFRAVQ